MISDSFTDHGDVDPILECSMPSFAAELQHYLTYHAPHYSALDALHLEKQASGHATESFPTLAPFHSHATLESERVHDLDRACQPCTHLHHICECNTHMVREPEKMPKERGNETPMTTRSPKKSVSSTFANSAYNDLGHHATPGVVS